MDPNRILFERLPFDSRANNTAWYYVYLCEFVTKMLDSVYPTAPTELLDLAHNSCPVRALFTRIKPS